MITEPFVLATYNSTLRESVSVGAYASVHCSPHNKLAEYVTVAAQADGVHILDVADLHPVMSHTLGPSTAFSCPPLTLPSSSKYIWTTYVVIAASPELPSQDDAGRTLWMWEVDSSSKERQKVKRTKPLFSKGKVVHGLYACPELQGRIVALSNAGDVVVLDAQSLEDMSTDSLSSVESRVLHAWIFAKSAIRFGDSQSDKGDIIILLSSKSPKSTNLRILAVDEANSISQITDDDIHVPSENIISASCSSSGYLSILAKDDVWYSYHLQSFLDSSVRAPLEPKPLHLANFSWLSSSNHQPPVSILALTSSHVLLASTSSAQEVILHIWDLQFGVLLGSYSVSIPSSLSSASTLHLTLVSGQENPQKLSSKSEIPSNQYISSQAYLLMSSIPPSSKRNGRTDKESSRSGTESRLTSVIFVIPYTVPRMSTLSTVIGRGPLSRQWLKNRTSTVTEGGTVKQSLKASAEEIAKTKVLSSVKSALKEGRIQAAEAAFMKSSTTQGQNDEERKLMFGYNFVKELLEIIFNSLSKGPQQSSSAKLAYPGGIVRFLLERGSISSAMLESYGGLLNVLRAPGDWGNVELAFGTVSDLSEVEIVETLRVVLAHHRLSLRDHPSSDTGDAMEVDSEIAPTQSQKPTLPPPTSISNTSTAIPLEDYLRLVLNYSTSRISLLLAFRRYMQDPEDVTVLLGVLSDWIAKRSKWEMEVECHDLMPSMKDLKKTSEGVWVVAGMKNDKSEMEPVPGMEKITNFISILLDASFLPLLSHKASHSMLRTLSTQIAPELGFVHAAQKLCGALEPFAIVQERTVRDSLVPKEVKEKEKQKLDWRQRKKGVGAGMGGLGANIGDYTLEELVL